MAEAKMDLGAFFSGKAKKKIKGSNLNVAKPEAKAESKKPGKKDAEEEGWEEQEVVAATMKVEVAGKLTREEDKKEEEDNSAPAWGALKKGDSSGINEKKFPSLAKSMYQSSNINIDDGSNAKINIETSKNAFQALGGGGDSDDDGPSRPSHIKPAMVVKKKGEFEKVALQREVDKYTKIQEKKKKKEKKNDDDEEESEDEEEEEVEEEVVEEVKEVAKKKVAKKVVKEEEPVAEEQGDQAEDTKIQPDLVAAKEKYAHRRKLPTKDLPKEELEEEKPGKAQPAGGGGKKKKKGGCIDEEEFDKKKKLQVWED